MDANVSNDPQVQPEADTSVSGKKLGSEIKKFFKELLDIRDESDRDATVEDVKKDISFKGHNAWILVFSIFVASIGLNVSSAAVIIGAMLISPLMGPIVGVGLSVAINDIDTLKRSLVNLGVMVVLSVLTAYFYFLISPIKQETPELVARTFPTILDVLVAIFGGLALIIAKTKKGTIASVIMGVAIATALMPPLCTVGYGLASGNWEYAGGAFYLFSINSVFIALSTFVVAKMLRFPMVKYANSKRRKRTARIATFIAVLVMIPSVILFIKLLEQQVFQTRSQEFVKEVVQYEGAEIVKATQDFKTGVIDVYLIGQRVPGEEIEKWTAELGEEPDLKNAVLRVHQGTDQHPDYAARLTSEVKSSILEDLYVQNQQVIEDKDARIRLLEEELTKYRGAGIPFERLSREARINYKGLEELSYANSITTNFKRIDTITTFSVKWDKSLSAANQEVERKKLYEWLQVRLSLDTLQVRTVR